MKLNIELLNIDFITLVRDFKKTVEFDMNEAAETTHDKLSDPRCSACIDPKRIKLSVSWNGKQHLNLFDLGDPLKTRHRI